MSTGTRTRAGWSGWVRCAVAPCALVGAVLAAGGCAFIGMMAASAEREGSSTRVAEYEGLVGHSFAVVAVVDRAIQAEFPSLQPELIQRMDLNLSANANASGHIPGDDVTGYLANHPQWVAWPRSRIAEELEVDRVVFVEVNDFRTNEPGNEHLWDGAAWATVSVYERGGDSTDAGAFRKEIRVGFPDQTGVGPEQVSKTVVASVLLKRVVDRACWLFYTHEEPNALTY